ncbi:hypothetical protein LINPERPRIM_LOCUS6438 [Linum perenne]
MQPPGRTKQLRVPADGRQGGAVGVAAVDGSTAAAESLGAATNSNGRGGVQPAGEPTSDEPIIFEPHVHFRFTWYIGLFRSINSE